MFTKMSHAQVVKVKRDGKTIAKVTGTWYRGRGWYYIRQHPGSKYTRELMTQLKTAGCTPAEIDSLIS